MEKERKLELREALPKDRHPTDPELVRDYSKERELQDGVKYWKPIISVPVFPVKLHINCEDRSSLGFQLSNGCYIPKGHADWAYFTTFWNDNCNDFLTDRHQDFMPCWERFGDNTEHEFWLERGSTTRQPTKLLMARLAKAIECGKIKTTDDLKKDSVAKHEMQASSGSKSSTDTSTGSQSSNAIGLSERMKRKRPLPPSTLPPHAAKSKYKMSDSNSVVDPK